MLDLIAAKHLLFFWAMLPAENGSTDRVLPKRQDSHREASCKHWQVNGQGMCCKLPAEIPTCKAGWVAAVPLLDFNPAGVDRGTAILTSNVKTNMFCHRYLSTTS